MMYRKYSEPNRPTVPNTAGMAQSSVPGPRQPPHREQPYDHDREVGQAARGHGYGPWQQEVYRGVAAGQHRAAVQRAAACPVKHARLSPVQVHPDHDGAEQPVRPGQDDDRQTQPVECLICHDDPRLCWCAPQHHPGAVCSCDNLHEACRRASFALGRDCRTAVLRVRQLLSLPASYNRRARGQAFRCPRGDTLSTARRSQPTAWMVPSPEGWIARVAASRKRVEMPEGGKGPEQESRSRDTTWPAAREGPGQGCAARVVAAPDRARSRPSRTPGSTGIGCSAWPLLEVALSAGWVTVVPVGRSPVEPAAGDACWSWRRA